MKPVQSEEEIQKAVGDIKLEIDGLGADILAIQEDINSVVGSVEGKIDGNSFYTVNAVNYLIHKLTEKRKDVKFIPYDPVGYDAALKNGLNDFKKNEDLKKLIIPIRPLFPKSFRESKEFSADWSKDKIREHFTGIYVEKDGIGGYKASYFDPTGLGEVNEIPRETLSSITTSLGIQESDIVPTKTVFQYSERQAGEIRPSFANNSCGAFVAQVLSDLALDNIKISDKNRSILRYRHKDIYKDLPGCNDNQLSNHTGEKIRNNHKKILSRLLQEKEQELLQSNAETLFIKIDNDFKKNVNQALFGLTAYEENELIEDQGKEKNFDLAKRLLLVAAERNLSQVIATLFEVFEERDINRNLLLNHRDQFGNIFFSDLIEKAKNEFGIKLLDVLGKDLLGIDSSGSKVTALQIAAAKNNDDKIPNYKLVEALINAGANPNPVVLDDREEMTVLDIAVARRDVEMVRKICDSVRSNNNFDELDSYLNKSLQYLDMDLVKVAKAIKEINPNFEFTKEEKSSFEENGSAIRDLISGKKNSSEVDNEAEIKEAEIKSLYENLAQMMLPEVKFDKVSFKEKAKRILSLEAESSYTGRGVLMIAALRGKSEAIAPLIEMVEEYDQEIANGKNLSYLPNPAEEFCRIDNVLYQNTPLLWAIANANNQFAKDLLDAVRKYKNQDGSNGYFTPINLEINYRSGDSGITALHLAAAKGYTDKDSDNKPVGIPNHQLVGELIDAGALNSSCSSGSSSNLLSSLTPINIAVIRRDVEMVRTICDKDDIESHLLLQSLHLLNNENLTLEEANKIMRFITTGRTASDGNDGITYKKLEAEEFNNEETKRQIAEIINKRLSAMLSSDDIDDEQNESTNSYQTNDEEEEKSKENESQVSVNMENIYEEEEEIKMSNNKTIPSGTAFDSSQYRVTRKNKKGYIEEVTTLADVLPKDKDIKYDENLTINRDDGGKASLVRDDENGDTLKNIINKMISESALNKTKKEVKTMSSFSELLSNLPKEDKTGKLWYQRFSKVDFVENDGEKIFGKAEIFMTDFNNCTFTNVDFSKVKFFENAGFHNCAFQDCTFSEDQKEFLNEWNNKSLEQQGRDIVPLSETDLADFEIKELKASPKTKITGARVQPLVPVKTNLISL